MRASAPGVLRRRRRRRRRRGPIFRILEAQSAGTRSRAKATAPAARLAPTLPTSLRRRQNDEGQSVDAAPASSFLFSFANSRAGSNLTISSNFHKVNNTLPWSDSSRNCREGSVHDVNRIVRCAGGTYLSRGELRDSRSHPPREVLVEKDDLLGPS